MSPNPWDQWPAATERMEPSRRDAHELTGDAVTGFQGSEDPNFLLRVRGGERGRRWVAKKAPDLVPCH